MSTGDLPVKAPRYQNSVVDKLLQRDAIADLNRTNQRLADYVGREPKQTLRAIDVEAPQATFTGTDKVPEVNATAFEINHLRSAMASHGCLIIRGLFNSTTMTDFCRVIDLAMEATEGQSKQDKRCFAHIAEIFSNPPSNFASLLPQPKLSNARKFHRDGGSAMCVESASVSEYTAGAL